MWFYLYLDYQLVLVLLEQDFWQAKQVNSWLRVPLHARFFGELYVKLLNKSVDLRAYLVISFHFFHRFL